MNDLINWKLLSAIFWSVYKMSILNANRDLTLVWRLNTVIKLNHILDYISSGQWCPMSKFFLLVRNSPIKSNFHTGNEVIVFLYFGRLSQQSCNNGFWDEGNIRTHSTKYVVDYGLSIWNSDCGIFILVICGCWIYIILEEFCHYFNRILKKRHIGGLRHDVRQIYIISTREKKSKSKLRWKCAKHSTIFFHIFCLNKFIYTLIRSCIKCFF